MMNSKVLGVSVMVTDVPTTLSLIDHWHTKSVENGEELV
jgi:hypothetical protein